MQRITIPGSVWTLPWRLLLVCFVMCLLETGGVCGGGNGNRGGRRQVSTVLGGYGVLRDGVVGSGGGSSLLGTTVPGKGDQLERLERLLHQPALPLLLLVLLLLLLLGSPPPIHPEDRKKHATHLARESERLGRPLGTEPDVTASRLPP